MKKYILPFTLAAVIALLTASCAQKDSEPWIVYYPAITLYGDTELFWEAGVPFVEPGYKATLRDEDITNDVKIVTDLNYANPSAGIYSIVYSASSPEGYQTTVTRTVCVLDSSLQ